MQMANLGMDPVHAAEYHIAVLFQRSHLLTGVDTPLCTPHPASCLIDYCVRADVLQIGDEMWIDPSDPDSARIIADQLQTLLDNQLVDDQGRIVEVFDSLGNVHPELLVENMGVGVVIGSGEPSPESSNSSSDCGESFAFGNGRSD